LVEVTASVEPSAAIALATARGAQAEWNGDVLALTNAKEHIEIDARTGRLLGYRDRSNPEALQVRFAEGVFENRSREVRQAMAERPNAFVSERPISSLLGFLTREDVLRGVLGPDAEKVIASSWSEVNVERLRLLHRLIELGTLEPLDDILQSGHDGPKQKFEIPPTLEPPNWLAAVAMAAVPWADPLFARGSWLWTVWRETGLTVAGRGAFTGQELDGLFSSPDTGPVCHLTVAWLLERFQPKAAHAFATRGTWLREAADFRKDFLPLLDQNSVAGKCLHQAGRILAAMEPQDLAQLTASLTKPWPDCLETLRAELARRRQDPIERVLPAALEASWNRGLGGLVMAALQDLRDRTANR
jgi:hypothetical protein